MELKGELVLEHEEDKWLTDSALLVDLITHLKELNRCREKSTYLEMLAAVNLFCLRGEILNSQMSVRIIWPPLK